MVSAVKVTLVGKDKSGKTKLATRFIHGGYDDGYIETIGVILSSKKNNPDVKLQVRDAAGQERFLSLMPMYLRGAGVIVINIALPSLAENFNPDGYLADVKTQIEKWVKLSRDNEPKAKLILALNQADLIKDAKKLKELSDNIQALAEANGIQAVCVTSAKEGTGVNELFEKVVGLAIPHAKTVNLPEQDIDQDLPAKNYTAPSKKSNLLSKLNHSNTFAFLLITALVLATVLFVLFPPVGAAAYLATGISAMGLGGLSMGAVAAIAGAAVGMAGLLLYGLGKAVHYLLSRNKQDTLEMEDFTKLENKQPLLPPKPVKIAEEKIPNGKQHSKMPGTAYALKGASSATDSTLVPPSDAPSSDNTLGY